MNATQQFYELIATEYSRIETLKQAAHERGEFIENVTAAYLSGEIDEATYQDLIARAGAETGAG